MEEIRGYVVTLVVALVFIKSAEMILPNYAKDIKSQCKLVLGAILIAVMINPIVKILSSGEEQIVDKIAAFSLEKTETEEKQKEAEEMRRESFAKNLSNNIDNILKNKFDNYSFSNEVICDVSFKTMDVEIKKVTVYVEEKGFGKIKKVEKVEKVEFDKQEEEIKTDSKYLDIRKFLAEELKIEEEKILVVEGEV